MRNNEKQFYLTMTLLAVLIAITLILAVCGTGDAESLPSPEAKAMISLTGDFALTGAEADMKIAECLRVDVKRWDADGAWAELTLPNIPPGICGVTLFDGWHLIHAQWQQTGETTMRLHFRAEDLETLDGTVGMYLVILAERTEE